MDNRLPVSYKLINIPIMLSTRMMLVSIGHTAGAGGCNRWRHNPVLSGLRCTEWGIVFSSRDPRIQLKGCCGRLHGVDRIDFGVEGLEAFGAGGFKQHG